MVEETLACKDLEDAFSRRVLIPIHRSNCMGHYEALMEKLVKRIKAKRLGNKRGLKDGATPS